MNDTTPTSTPAEASDDQPPREPATEASPAGGGRRRGSRRKRIALALLGTVIGLALAVVAAVLVLPGGSGSDVKAYRNTPPKSVKYVDGLVIKATGSTFMLLTQDRRRVTLYVRPPDRPYIDVQHAQTHASLGQPVRVFWKTIDKRRSVVYMADSPLIF
ncbi:MAG: hypothetical protein H7123_03645 [Thermoleophilia bacterium]|nr:hypothetical protein [Thermoleophilia bacterium]